MLPRWNAGLILRLFFQGAVSKPTWPIRFWQGLMHNLHNAGKGMNYAVP
jgi:hypothetical protein